jgi:prolyl oligopeptidase
VRKLSQTSYPESKRLDIVDEIYGVAIADPYRWLEEVEAVETKEWIRDQNQLTFEYLEGINSRNKINARMRQLWDYEKFGLPKKSGGRYFYTRNDGLQNQGALYWMDSIEDEPKLLLDPNTLSEDGTVALIDYAPSKDGRLMAYGLSAAGSDWQTWRVRDVQSGQDLEDVVEWVKFSVASWTLDGRGFFYSRYDEPSQETTFKGANYFQKLYFHEIGTSQSQDQLIYERLDQKEWGFFGEVTDDGGYLIITVFQGTQPENAIFFVDLANPSKVVIELLNEFDASYYFIGNDDSQFHFLTDLDAPMSRLITIDINQPHRDTWQTIIPETTNSLANVTVAGDRFLAAYLEDAHSQLRLFNKEGQIIDDIDLPGIGTVIGIEGHPNDDELFYSYNSITQPATIIRYDTRLETSSVFRQPKLGFEPEQFITSQRFYKSKDGTRIPMFISHRKDVKPGPNSALYLYGYGGFNNSMTPNFSAANLAWMEMGATFVQASLRGGGEYGKSWHEAGMKLNRQNVFDDFIAGAEYLIDKGYTSKDKLAIGGRSNGGLLVGACLTQRPDLFGGALMYVGVLDMIRFTKFTIGWAWTSDYGSPEDPDEFKALLAYSPYHNLSPGTHYPPTLVLTGDHDDRVYPAHSFKFAAALQAAQVGTGPTLIRVDTNAGHGLGKPTDKLIEESADGWAFLVEALDFQADL